MARFKHRSTPCGLAHLLWPATREFITRQACDNQKTDEPKSRLSLIQQRSMPRVFSHLLRLAKRELITLASARQPKNQRAEVQAVFFKKKQSNCQDSSTARRLVVWRISSGQQHTSTSLDKCATTDKPKSRSPGRLFFRTAQCLVFFRIFSGWQNASYSLGKRAAVKNRRAEVQAIFFQLLIPEPVVQLARFKNRSTLCGLAHLISSSR